MSITTALKARHDSMRDREAGFTLIELLVVVLIIGILAAIAIPVYIGVQNSAKDAAVKSDLVNEKTALSAYGTDANGEVPSAVTKPGVATVTAGTKDLTAYGWSVSTNTSGLVYSVGAAGSTNKGLWCIVGTSSTGNGFVVTSNTQVTSGAACPAAF